MRGLTIVKSLLVRVFLLVHGLLFSWHVIDTHENQYCWIILVGLGFLLVETGIVIWLRNGHEFKTIAFSIIFYLSCTIPSLWLIHIDTANKKLFHLAEVKLNARAAIPSIHSRQLNSISNSTSSLSLPASDGPASQMARLLLPTTPIIPSIGLLECHDKAWYYMDEQRWLDALQETMLIILCIARFTISREYMSVPKSGIVLVLTLINGIDLIAMSNLLQYHDIMTERLWMYIGLVLMSIGFFQIAMIDTDGLAVSVDQSKTNHKKKLSQRIHFLQDQIIYPLFRCLFLHDGLLLFYRTITVARVRCSKPTIIFFMAKNVLLMVLHCYRVYRIAKDRHKRKTFAAYENLINLSTLSRGYRHPFSNFERDHSRKKKYREKLLHRTLRQPASIHHRRATKSSRTLPTLSLNSISYPFARRRNDGGRARTAFALYGLPFHTPVAPRPATISSTSSLVAKAFVH